MFYFRGIKQVFILRKEFCENVNCCAAVVAQTGKVVEKTFGVESYSHIISGDQTIELAPRIAASDSLSDE